VRSKTDAQKSKVRSNTRTQKSKSGPNLELTWKHGYVIGVQKQRPKVRIGVDTGAQMSKLKTDTGGDMYKRNLAAYVEAESISTCAVPYSAKYAAWEVVRAVGHDPSRIGYRPSMSLLLEWGKRCELVVTEDTLSIQLRDDRGATTFVATLDRKTMSRAHIQAMADIISRSRNLKIDPNFVAESDRED